MELQSLLSHYDPMYPASAKWEDTVADLTADPIENAIIEHLCMILRTEGSFRKPITLGVRVFDDADGTEQEAPAVVNGTHRIVAHILTNTTEVSVQEEPAHEEEDDDATSFTSWETRLELAEDVAEDNISDLMFSILRSFPLDEKTWVESSISSQSKNHFCFFWDDGVNTETLKKVHSKVQAILHAHNIKVLSVDTGLVTYYDN